MALDILSQPPQNIAKLEKAPLPVNAEVVAESMKLSQTSPSPAKKVNPEQCKHPRVQIVSRDEETEYVECQECRDVFESSELKDMAIEEKKELEED